MVFVSLILRVFATVWVIQILKRQNRRPLLLGILCALFPLIIMVIVGFLKKLYLKPTTSSDLSGNENSEIVKLKFDSEYKIDTAAAEPIIKFEENILDLPNADKKAIKTNQMNKDKNEVIFTSGFNNEDRNIVNQSNSKTRKIIIGILILLTIGLSIYVVNEVTKPVKFTNIKLEINKKTYLHFNDDEEIAIKLLEQHLNENKTIYRKRIKYPTGDIGYLFMTDYIGDKRTILFTVVQNKYRGSKYMDDDYHLNVLQEDNYYRISYVDLERIYGSSGFIVSNNYFKLSIN